MNTTKISKPFSKKFNTLLNGNVVSYSPKSLKVAIGNDAVVVSSEKMREIVETDNSYGERFNLVVATFTENNY